MTTLAFADEHAYGDRHKITVPIRIENLPYLVDALIDTGAMISLFDKALLPDLGINDVTTGHKIPIRAANNASAVGYVHAVHIELFGRTMTIPAAFSEDWPEGIQNLLGMRGFFEQLLIAFEHRERKFHYLIH